MTSTGPNRERQTPVLDFRQDRLDYGRLLIPPEDHRLDRAIAVTYSLDLNTLLSIPVALFYSQTLEGKLDGERFQVLEAIRRTAGIVTVYCQEGQIHVPDRYNRLFAFMEDTIIPVRMKDAFTSFHPKVWVLRYVRDGAGEKAFYRVLVLSRNLTYDRSWDLAITLEGRMGATTRSTNRPLIEFLAHLKSIRPFADFHRFTRDLAKVKFDVPEGFKRLAFHPVGIDGHRESPLVNHDADATLCMSPFIDDETVTKLRERVRGDFWLFGRKREMAKLDRETVDGCNAYCISDLVVEGESLADVDGSNEERLDQDLHAKLFVFQQADTCRWFVGSANATSAARARNTEFMVELVGDDRRVTLERAIEDLLGADRNSSVFEKFHPESAGQPDPNAKRRAAVRRLEYELAQAPLRGSLELAANQTNYDLTISLNLRGVREAKGLTLEAGPLNCSELVPAEFGKPNQLAFGNIRETEISRFVVFAINDGEELLRHFVLRYEVDGIPTTRNDTIFKSVVSNSNQFFEYLRFLLADEVSKGDLFPQPPNREKQAQGDDGFLWHARLPIFESIIVAASRDPVKLKAVDGVIQRLRASGPTEEPLIPQEFLDFWEVFRPLIAPLDGKDSIDGE
jgi:hypothetical protein